MKRNPWIWVVTALVLAPFAWLLLTTDFTYTDHGTTVIGGACMTGLVVVALLWRAHFRGTLLPNPCRTCGHGMRRVRHGELRPPASVKDKHLPSWRCVRCGRMV